MGLCHFPPHPMNNPWPQRHRQQLWVLGERLSLKQSVKTVFTCTQQEGEKSFYIGREAGGGGGGRVYFCVWGSWGSCLWTQTNIRCDAAAVCTNECLDSRDGYKVKSAISIGDTWRESHFFKRLPARILHETRWRGVGWGGGVTCSKRSEEVTPWEIWRHRV